MFSVLVGALAALALSVPAAAQVTPFPGDFRTQEITTADGATIHLRVGGHGPAVVLLHGFGDTGDMWAPLAAELARDHTVVVSDLRGMGLSSHPGDGDDKRTQAADVRAVLTHLGLDRAVIVGHDLGTIVAYAYAARSPDQTEKLVVMDAPLPGIPPWDELVRHPRLWHFPFGGPDAERLVAGRERVYLDRFWNEFAGDPAKIDEATRVHDAQLYARPGAMRSAFAQFLAFPTDVEDKKALMATKLTMPVLAIGGEKFFGAKQAVVMRHAATQVTEVVIPNAGHWLMEEHPAATMTAIRTFLDAKHRPAPRRLFDHAGTPVHVPLQEPGPSPPASLPGMASRSIPSVLACFRGEYCRCSPLWKLTNSDRESPMEYLQSAAEFLTAFACSLFAGAAVYITMVEHPARVACGTEFAIMEFAPSYRRAAVMQASLAIAGFVFAVMAWLTGGTGWWLVGGLLLVSVVPFTLLVIMPTNKALLDSSLDKRSARAAELLSLWGQLHAVRSLMSTLALGLFLYLLTVS